MPVDHSRESSTTKRATKSAISIEGHSPEQQLPCPRCDSLVTKFCYYNNYNPSQPRHFCKSCRRYWTHGGALRDIPVGGGSRKSSAKRSRSSSSSGNTVQMSPLLGSPLPSNVLLPISSPHLPSYPLSAPVGAFSSLLNSHQGTPDLLGFAGFELSSELEDVGAACYGLARGTTWAFPDNGKAGIHGVSSIAMSNTFVDGMVGGSNGGSNGSQSHAWQYDAGGSTLFSLGVGDCMIPWPELAISTSANGLK